MFGLKFASRCTDAHLSELFHGVPVNYKEKCVMTFFVRNLISYIFLSAFFSASDLGTKLLAKDMPRGHECGN